MTNLENLVVDRFATAFEAVTVTLEDLGERTRMVFHVDGVGGQPGDESVYDGWDSAFDVLTRHLA